MLPLQRKILVPIIAICVLGYFMCGMGLPDALDIHFYYSPIEATQFFAGQTASQANIYLEHELLDLMFIFSYTALFFFTLEEIFFELPKLKFIALIPGFFDIIETVAIIAVLLGAPMRLVVGWLGVATLLKWITIGGVIFLILVHIGTILKKRLRAT